MNDLIPFGYSRGSKYSLWGYKKKDGQIAIVPKYYVAKPFCNGFARVIKYCDTKHDWNFVTENGIELYRGTNKIILAYDFNEKYAAIVIEDGDEYISMFIDEKGKTMNPLNGRNLFLSPICKGVFIAGISSSDSLNRTNLNLYKANDYGVISFVFNGKNNSANQIKNVIFGMVNINMEIVHDFSFTGFNYFCDGVAIVSNISLNGTDRIYFLITSDGYKQEIGVANDCKLSGGVISLKINKIWKFYDLNLNLLHIYDDFNYQALEFINGHAIVKVNDKYGIIDSLGKFVFSPQYSYTSNIYDGKFWVVKENIEAIELAKKLGIRVSSLPDKINLVFCLMDFNKNVLLEKTLKVPADEVENYLITIVSENLHLLHYFERLGYTGCIIHYFTDQQIEYNS